MNSALLRVAAGLLDERRPYALATVVHRERPSSAAPGNTALITGDGRLHGWIGGSCTQPEVVRHALAALADGRSRLLGFGVAPDANRDIVPVPMSCGSEGRVEVHINPVFPAPQLVVAGSSPIADAVARLGEAMGYPVVRAEATGAGDPGAEAPEWADRAPGARLFAVVATMGQGDEDAVVRLLAARPDYIGVVVSPKRMRQVRSVLGELGVGADQVARVHGPAGLDIGAESPEEVAVSILAEIVAVGAGKGAAGGAERAAKREACCAGAAESAGGEAEAECGADDETEPAAAATPAGATGHAIDPVCGMTVPVDGSRPSFTHEGRTVHFCCHGCRTRFEANPETWQPVDEAPRHSSGDASGPDRGAHAPKMS